MKTLGFSVYDLKALNYGVPFFMPTVGAAVRAFGDLANDPQSMVAKHPTDYVLFQIGEFDDSIGLMKCLTPQAKLGMASDFVPPVAEKVSRIPDDQIPLKLLRKEPCGSCAE